ncbi:unnamed protein product [Angiostrongylus costaricensis]|uniref:Phage protein n=1 Tax=Angiostrongylus costaricensis TaxID=334426 RepID=A0A0R3Q2I7_ANGCS|nr:unnamed protein product [Angiostrongylus costaricensis]
MEKEIKDKLSVFAKPNADELKTMMNYAAIKQAHLKSIGEKIEEVPAGSTIEVVFDNYTKNLALDGCVYAGVEIKT